MFIPAARQHVFVEDRTQPYFVLAVDRDAQVAYLVDMRGSAYVEAVGFAKLRPAPELPA